MLMCDDSKELIAFAKLLKERNGVPGHCPVCNHDTLIIKLPPVYPDGVCDNCIRSIAEVYAVGIFSSRSEADTKRLMYVVLDTYREYLGISAGSEGTTQLIAMIDGHYPKCRQARTRFIALGYIKADRD